MSASQVLAISLGLSALGCAPAVARQPPLSPISDLSRRVLAADRAAIREAGESGDRTLIPFLTSVLEDPRLDGSKGRPALDVEIALAKLEDTPTQQLIWCAAIGEDLKPPISLFGRIGGWFSLQALDAILSGVGDAANLRAVRQQQPTDISYLAPVMLALQTLPTVAPDGPEMDWIAHGAAGRWREWIAAHRQELSTRKPVGDGVVYTDKACKDGKPIKKR